MKEQVIPVYIIEEHHEAFRVWQQAITEGRMQAKDNCLLHIDEHDDMKGGQFKESLLSLDRELKRVEKFTYKELNIANFILPACYCGMINQVYWVRQNHRNTKMESQRMYIRSYNQAGRKLIYGKARPITTEQVTDDYRVFDYFLVEPTALPFRREVILDIDLDYFSCVRNPGVSRELFIEITKQEFDNFVTNPYHRLNYMGLGRVEAICQEGKYYYVINDYLEVYPSDLEVDESEIRRRVDELISSLCQNEIRPLLIDICRSRYSGYTPWNQWEFIEHTLWEALSNLYKLEKITLSSVLVNQ